MLRWALVGLAAVAFVSTARTDEAEKELAKLQGKWSVESIEENGVKEPDDEAKKFQITIKGKLFVVNLYGKEESMTIAIDPAKSPKTIDMTPNYGEDKSKTAPGIYELDGDKLRICACPKGERPKKFTSEKGILVLVLKKAVAER